MHPGVDEGKPVHAQPLATRAPVPAGAGVGVESKGWLRDHALDAQERSQTQWCTRTRALWIRFIP